MLEKDSLDGHVCQDKSVAADAFFLRSCETKNHKEPVPACVRTSCVRFLAALLVQHGWCGVKATIEICNSGSWVIKVFTCRKRWHFFG